MSIYLDANAATPLFLETKRAFCEALDMAGNPSSVHANGRFLKKEIEATRTIIAKELNLPSIHILFGSNASELHTMLFTSMKGPVAAMRTSHPSISMQRPDITLIDVDHNGLVDLNHLEDTLKTKQYSLLSLIAGHNETGVIQDSKEAFDLCKRYGAALHVDALQVFCKVDYPYEYADFITINGSKWGGPLGVAVLGARDGLSALTPLVRGAGQEFRLRSGSENVPAIIALRHGIEHAKTVDLSHHRVWHDQLVDTIKNINPNVICVGNGAKRLFNTTCLITPGIVNKTQVIHFDLKGISVSSGSACSSGSVKTSQSLLAMNVNHPECAIRISTSWANTQKDLDAFMNAWQNLYEHHQNKSTY